VLLHEYKKIKIKNQKTYSISKKKFFFCYENKAAYGCEPQRSALFFLKAALREKVTVN